jgi:L-fuconolactonase
VAAKIDAHHHLWRYNATEYGWLTDEMKAMRRDFLPKDLMAELAGAGIDGTVAVQARQTLDETRWLLDLADECEAIRGVVGWAPIAGEDFPGVMEEFEHRTKLKGLRHVIQAEPDENYILRADFNAGIEAMQGSGLVYDILIYDRHLPQTIEFVDQYPDQVFVLDHIAKPQIAAALMEPWSENLHELALRKNVWCKVSGLVTEAEWKSWNIETLRPYLDTVVDAFGANRLMAGSDWPVCLVATEYKAWFEVLRSYFAAFSDSERDAIFGGTATQVYGLE